MNRPGHAGRCDVRVVSLFLSSLGLSVRFVHVSLPSETCCGVPSPPGQNSDGAPHSVGLSLPGPL